MGVIDIFALVLQDIKVDHPAVSAFQDVNFASPSIACLLFATILAKLNNGTNFYPEATGVNIHIDDIMSCLTC